MLVDSVIIGIARILSGGGEVALVFLEKVVNLF